MVDVKKKFNTEGNREWRWGDLEKGDRGILRYECHILRDNYPYFVWETILVSFCHYFVTCVGGQFSGLC